MKPFPVDAAVLAAIRPMEPRDAAAVARLHHAAMGTSLWARLGPLFLERLYGGLVHNPRLLAFVYEEDGRVRGFIAGATDASRLFREVLMRAAPSLLLPALLGVLRDPALLIPLLTTPMYFIRSRVAPDLGSVSAESMFCSFEPDLRGRRIAGHINKVLFDDLLHRGHERVKVTTEVDNHEAVRQLESWGFERHGWFRFYGKDMAVFILDLAACERVEPVRRHPAEG